MVDSDSSSRHRVKRGALLLNIENPENFVYKRSNPTKVKQTNADGGYSDFSSSSEDDSANGSVTRSSQSYKAAAYYRDIALTPHPVRQKALREREGARIHGRSRSASSPNHSTPRSNRPRSVSQRRSRRSQNNSERDVVVETTPEEEARFVVQFKKSHLDRIMSAMKEDSDDALLCLIVKTPQLIPFAEYNREKEERRRARRAAHHRH